MGTILRATLLYWFMLFILRAVPRRTGDIVTPFEFILIFLIGGLSIQVVEIRRSLARKRLVRHHHSRNEPLHSGNAQTKVRMVRPHRRRHSHRPVSSRKMVQGPHGHSSISATGRFDCSARPGSDIHRQSEASCSSAEWRLFHY